MVGAVSLDLCNKGMPDTSIERGQPRDADSFLPLIIQFAHMFVLPRSPHYRNLCMRMHTRLIISAAERVCKVRGSMKEAITFIPPYAQEARALCKVSAAPHR